MYKIKQISFLLLMSLSSIFYNIIMFVVIIIVTIPLLVWKKKDFNNNIDMLFRAIPDIPDPKDYNDKE